MKRFIVILILFVVGMSGLIAVDYIYDHYAYKSGMINNNGGE